MKSNIALIGFMGTGKTEVAKVLAQKLDKAVVDVDDIIVKNAGKSIAAIFREDGEVRFRELEIEAVKQLARKMNAVIACGGGVILNQINIDRLKKESVIIWLTASPPVILKRLVDDKENRPLLAMTDRVATIKTLLKNRQPLYRQAAEITINTSGLNIGAVVDKILGSLKNYESRD
jgi:shikimate kinase